MDFTHIFKRFRGQFERTDLILNPNVRARWIKEYNLSPVEQHCSFHWIRLLKQQEDIEREEHGAAFTFTHLLQSDIFLQDFKGCV